MQKSWNKIDKSFQNRRSFVRTWLEGSFLCFKESFPSKITLCFQIASAAWCMSLALIKRHFSFAFLFVNLNMHILTSLGQLSSYFCKDGEDSNL